MPAYIYVTKYSEVELNEYGSNTNTYHYVQCTWHRISKEHSSEVCPGKSPAKSYHNSLFVGLRPVIQILDEGAGEGILPRRSRGKMPCQRSNRTDNLNYQVNINFQWIIMWITRTPIMHID